MLVHGVARPTALAANRRTPSDWVETLLDRPLFSGTRRPPAPLADMAPPPPSPLPRLTGILVYDGERHAIFAAPVGGRSVVALEGGRVGRFIVLKIEPQQVTVSGPEGVQAVRMRFDPAPPIATAARPLALLALSAGMAP